MVWFYVRNNQELRLETRYDNDASEYVLAVRHPDGHEEVERFADAVMFRRRLMALEQQLESERWRAGGGPVFLPKGWPDKPLAEH